MTAVDPATRYEIAETLHSWRIGDFYGGHTRIAYSEAKAMADALAPLIARLCAEKVDQALAGVEAALTEQADKRARRSTKDSASYAAMLAWDDAARIVAARRTGDEG